MSVSLLCLPCAGASASMYLRWKRLLPRWVRLVPIELPGRGGRMAAPFLEDFDELVDKLCDGYAHHCGSRYVLFGHSMGGLIAHGMAMRWRARAQRMPEMLLASASPAPRHRDPGYFTDKQTDADLITELRKQGGTPDEVFENAEMLRITLDTLRADYRLCSGYRYRRSAPLALPIHVFAGRQDDIAVERIVAWDAETSGPFEVRWFDGGHFFIREHESSFLQAIAALLPNDGAPLRAATDTVPTPALTA